MIGTINGCADLNGMGDWVEVATSTYLLGGVGGVRSVCVAERGGGGYGMPYTNTLFYKVGTRKAHGGELIRRSILLYARRTSVVVGSFIGL